MSELDLDLNVQCGEWNRIASLEKLIGTAARAATAAARPGDGLLEVSLMLTSDEEIAGLNAAYRRREGPTNVLSFPQAMPASPDGMGAAGKTPARLIGDIVLAYETVEREAKAAAKPIENHIAHLVVHGMLHLFGYDHEDDAEAEKMERLEAVILSGLGIADPYGEATNGGGGADLAAAGTGK
jgi:probable rRNA maturation factor